MIKMNPLRAYIQACRLVYNQCLEERRYRRGLKQEQKQKQKHAIISTSERVRLIYQRIRNNNGRV
jgi:hypothetical protein